MTGKMQNMVLIALIVLVAIFIIYQYDPSLFGLLGRREGFDGAMSDAGALANPPSAAPPGMGASPGAPQRAQNKAAGVATPPGQSAGLAAPYTTDGFTDGPEMKKKGLNGKEGFADLASFEGPASFGNAQAPAGCYPRDQLTPSELLPTDQSSIYAQQNPMGPGSLKGKNFLSAGALIGVNTVGQSLRNANLQLRSEPPNPQVPVSIFQNSTISPDISHRPLEIGA